MIMNHNARKWVEKGEREREKKNAFQQRITKNKIAISRQWRTYVLCAAEGGREGREIQTNRNHCKETQIKRELF
jgi:hypothetical protein